MNQNPMNTKHLKGLVTSEIQIVLLAKFIIRAKNIGPMKHQSNGILQDPKSH